MIETTYRVEVVIPEQVLQAFGRDHAFAFALTQATRWHRAAGRGRSAELGAYEWAEFSDRAIAEACERELQEAVCRFHARLPLVASSWKWRVA